MMSFLGLVLSSFTSPENIGTNPQAMLWMFPLAASIAIVYKAVKVGDIKAVNFVKQAAILFATIIIFVAAAAVALCILVWLFIE